MILEFSKSYNKFDNDDNQNMDQEDTLNQDIVNMQDEINEDKMIDFSLEEIKQKTQERKNFSKQLSSKIMNRRYKKLEELIEEGDYFSEENIIRREPALYQLYIGRYIKEPGPAGNFDMNDFLQDSAKKGELKEKILKFIDDNPCYVDSLKESEKVLGGPELEDAEDELIVLMHHRFLSGMDLEFINYSEIDYNEYEFFMIVFVNFVANMMILR
jgi:hypothetical protein